MDKRIWWISVGRFVLQTPRVWESLIGVDNYKGLFDTVSITIATCNYVIKQLKESFVKISAEWHSYTVTLSQIDQSNLVGDLYCTLVLVICSRANISPTELDWSFCERVAMYVVLLWLWEMHMKESSEWADFFHKAFLELFDDVATSGNCYWHFVKKAFVIVNTY